MREIKARAWDREDEECAVMVYSDRRNEKDYQIEYEFTFDEKGNLVCRWMEDHDDSFGDSVTNYGTLDNIMLYTGLNDKNGTEIYDGDIYRDSLGWLAVVKWAKWRYIGYTIENERKIACVDRDPRVEVVGNIYENPELLEVENDYK